MLSGRATPEATQARLSRFPQLASATLGTTRYQVSQAGFGGYRIDARMPAHRDALRHALRSGINLIDTSANYTDGQSETLIGEVLSELVAAGELRREEIVVVSKAGYIQGQNFATAQERERLGTPFPEVVKLQDGLWHCLHPEFLADQLQRTLKRLGLANLDVLLLHNPEYFLKSSRDRAEYERRLQEAFRFLESQVETGAIAYYGISSNTFPDASATPAFTSLERCLALAAEITPDHRFRVIQFPANLFECGFVLEPNQQGGRSVLDLARDVDLGVLINRPLNALSDRAMVRLADFPKGAWLDQDGLKAELADVAETERMLLASDPKNEALNQCLVIGPMLAANLHQIHGLEDWQGVVAYHFFPRLETASDILAQHPAIPKYRERVIQLFQRISAHFVQVAHLRAEGFHQQLNGLLPLEWHPMPLSQKAVGLLRSLDGVDGVLVGMRHTSYVDDVLKGLSGPRLGDARRVWEALPGRLV